MVAVDQEMISALGWPLELFKQECHCVFPAEAENNEPVAQWDCVDFLLM